MTSLALRPMAVGKGRWAALAVLALAVLVSVVPPATAMDEPDPVGVWPLQPEPEVVTSFDPPAAPWGSGHRGVDLLGRAGQDVHAALAGRVTYAGLLAGRGVVVVDHGATRTTYEPVSATVAVGDLLDRDAVIGRLDPIASHCTPRVCLHWGWRRGETYLDPLGLVGAGPVRLLPLWLEQPDLPAPPRSPVPFGLVTTLSLAPGVPWGVPYALGCACW